MSLTHIEIIEAAEKRLLNALVSKDAKSVSRLLHPDVIYTNEEGDTFIGISELPKMVSGIFKIEQFKIRSRSINVFTNVAIVNTNEWRSGIYRDMNFEGEYRITRTWKFSGRQWQLIASNHVLLSDTPK